MATLDLYQLTACPLCGGTYWKDCIFVVPMEFEKEKTGVEEMKYVVCQCGLMFADLYIRDIEEYYRTLYRKSPDAPDGEVSQENLLREIERADRLISEILPRANKVTRALDFGGSSGVLLSKLNEYYGCEMQNVELSDAYRTYSNEHGVPAIDTLAGANIEFDLVSAIHVLEHTLDPIGMLNSLMHKGTEETTFVIEVPFFDPRINHPVLYTVATARAVIEKAGLVISDVVLAKDITVFARRGE